LPIAKETYDEEKTGLLVFDECGTWFNARTWNEKGRHELNSWLLHARKKGWDVIFVVQDIEIVDAQARKALGELTGFCRDLSKVRVPVIGGIWKALSGKPLFFPKAHVCTIVNGVNRATDPVYDRWIYKGVCYYKYYDTKQCFSPYYSNGTYSVLPPWYTKGRYLKPRGNRRMRITRILWRKYSRPAVAFAGLCLGVVTSAAVYLSTLPPVPVAEVAAAQEKKVEAKQERDDKRKLEYIELVESLVFVGSYQINQLLVYTFHHPKLGDLDSTSQFFAGVFFQRIGDCAIRISKPGVVEKYLVCDQKKKDSQSDDSAFQSVAMDSIF